MKALVLAITGLVAVATLSATPESLAPPLPTAPEKTTHASPQAEEEIASLLRIGNTKLKDHAWEFSQLAYNQVINAGPTARPDQVRTALIGMARAYRGEGNLTKASAIYERYIKDNPDDSDLPTVYLELGRCLRALGAHQLAIARFYSVLNTTLKLPEDGGTTYRQLTRTAQFEIAETYFLSGDYEQAHRFYSRLSLLDLAPNDRAHATFKAACALDLKGAHEQAVTRLRSYLSLYPNGEDAAEARSLLSFALRSLGRASESLAATLELLKTEKAHSPDAETWAYWQRKTGNQLANGFYEQGDINTALTLYQSLRDLGGAPEWLLPVKYQIGLCQERLHQPELARITYQSILDSLGGAVVDSQQKSPAILQDINVMVKWRLKHLDWLETTLKRLPLSAPPDAGMPIRPPALAATP